MKRIITIMTPTFNRSKNLLKLFESIKEQNFNLKEIEWIIIDDGSIDNTEEVVHSFIEENKFDIIYKKTENKGKHNAVNCGIELANSDYFFIVDSDDYLPENALNIIIYWFSTIIDADNFAGIGGLKSFSTKEHVGTTFKDKFLDCTSIERSKNNIQGDKAEVFYTDLIKKYRFPVFENEKFLSESVLWNKIARDGYKIRWFNETIYLCEYMEDGLTKNIYKNLAKSPKGFLLYIKELIQYEAKTEIKKMYYAGTYFYLVKDYSLNSLSKELKMKKIEILLGSLMFKLKQMIRK